MPPLWSDPPVVPDPVPDPAPEENDDLAENYEIPRLPVLANIPPPTRVWLPDVDEQPTTTCPADDPHADLGVWGTVKLSLKGEELDYTTGPLGRAILLLSIPMVLEMAMESVFALTDAFFVSRLGTDAVATVGLTEAMVTILFAVAFGLSIGTTAMVARRIGENDKPGARIAAAQSILLGLAVSAAFAIPGIIFARQLLAAMGGSPELVASGYGFTRIIFGGCGTIVLLFLLNAVFRGAGDAAIAMRVLWIANAVNIVLDPCLIFGLGPFPEMGVTGAAVATTIGRGIGVAVQLVVLFFGGSRIRIAVHHLIPRIRIMLRLFRLSLGGMLQTVISHSSWLVLVWIVGSFGAPAVAGYTIAIRLVIFALLPSWGLANAAATLVGQNLGAERPDRAERSAWLAGIFNTVFLLTSSLTMALAIAALQRHDKKLSIQMLNATLGFAVVFCVVKAFEWGSKFEHGIWPGSDHVKAMDLGKQAFYNMYYTMTGLHALHVVLEIVGQLSGRRETFDRLRQPAHTAQHSAA